MSDLPRVSLPERPPPPAAPPLQPPPLNSRGGVSARSVLVSLALMVATIFWVTVSEVRWYTLDGTSLPIFIQPVFFLFVLGLLNLLVKKWRGEPFLQPGELIVIYAMVALACVFAGHDMLQNLFGVMGHPYRFASEQNRWAERFLDLVPTWLFVTDQDSLQGFYGGSVNPYNPRMLLPWVKPLLWWSVFIFSQTVVFLCINILLRRHWTQHEKLTFPLIQLPLAMAGGGPGRPIWSSKVMWAGFLLAGSIALLNGFHYLYPSIPDIPYVKLFRPLEKLDTRPWSVIRDTRMSMYPFIIGLAYFIPTDLSFSCWFFFLWRKGQQVLGAAMGWDGAANRGWPYFQEQSSGAWIGLILILIWHNRAYLQQLGAQILGQRRSTVPAGEMREYRWACVGIAGGILLLFVFMLVMGLTPLVAAIFLMLYMGLSVAITRIRAELGTPHEINYVSPQAIMLNTMGSEFLGRQNMTALASMHWFNRGYRCHPMPNQLESFKMAEDGRVQLRRLYILTLVASLIAIYITFWANLHLTFLAGATGKAVGFKRWVGNESFNRLNGWIVNPVRAEVTNTGFLMGGMIFTLALNALRRQFAWWPFHPAGYALATSFAMDYFWFGFMISWAAKLTLVRYGGMRLHTAAAPFFLGLIMGDFVIGSIWSLWGCSMGMSTYKIFI